MALRTFSFDGLSSDIYLGRQDIAAVSELPSESHWSIDGETCYSFVANYDKANELNWSGLLPETISSALYAKLLNKTVGSLVTTFGTCTAVLLSCAIQPGPAAVSGEDYLAAVSLKWLRLSPYS